MKRVALFAHFDRNDQVKNYVVSYVRALAEVCETVVFVSTSRLPASERAKVEPHCQRILLRENVGWDFGMWQAALAELDLSMADELLLTNSSAFGPIFPLAPILARMSQTPCDFWGMTDNYEIAWHLQSFFLVFKRPAFTSARFRDFFRSILLYKDKDQVIRSYELGLTRYLQEGGLVPATFVPTGVWIESERGRRRLHKKGLNTTLYFPLQLLRLGMPFVKMQLLRDNPARVRLSPVLRAMEASGYDMRQVEL